ncbi:hypothetical protein COOONC_21309 [Cooperia oncophora]
MYALEWFFESEKADKEPAILKAKKRKRPGVRALQEIRHLQRTTELQIPRISFQRVVREVANKIAAERGIKEDLRWQSNALLALQGGSRGIPNLFVRGHKLGSDPCSSSHDYAQGHQARSENTRGEHHHALVNACSLVNSTGCM